jgi:histidine triad (HIT) family protein
MASIFTRIIKGEIPAYKILEDQDFFAFLDINPLAAGHTLVVPKQEVDYIFDLPDDLYKGLFSFAKKVAGGIGKTIPCTKVGITVIGLEVPHAHIHLIPVNRITDMEFSRPKLKFSPEEFEEIATRIRAEL